MANFLGDALAKFWLETPDGPVVDLTLSSPGTPSEIKLLDVIDEAPTHT